jgi:hypothetical protein
MSSYALCTVVLSAEGQVSGADLRNVWDRCGSDSTSRVASLGDASAHHSRLRESLVGTYESVGHYGTGLPDLSDLAL